MSDQTWQAEFIPHEGPTSALTEPLDPSQLAEGLRIRLRMFDGDTEIVCTVTDVKSDEEGTYTVTARVDRPGDPDLWMYYEVPTDVEP
jgi:hypothetical protein